jgi:hypothetical protein
MFGLLINGNDRTSEGWLQPEIEYVYNVAMPDDVDERLFEPKPLDGEVECFEVRACYGLGSIADRGQLMDQTTVTAKLRAGLFKPNCGLGM